MSVQGKGAGRVGLAHTALGSTICLASSFGLQAATTTESGTDLTEVVVTAHPSVDAYATTLQDVAQNVTVVPGQLPRPFAPRELRGVI